MLSVLTKVIGYSRSILHVRRLRHWQPFLLEGRLRLFIRHGTLEIGRRAHLWPDVKISITGTPSAPATVRIGPNSSIGDRTQIHACRLVEIGRGTRISWDVNILENNYHAQSKGPITIEDDVWIACRAIILSGVRIGRGAIVGAGSVVTKDVPPNTVVAGNPAHVVRQVTQEPQRER